MQSVSSETRTGTRARLKPLLKPVRTADRGRTQSQYADVSLPGALLHAATAPRAPLTAPRAAVPYVTLQSCCRSFLKTYNDHLD